MKIIKVETVLSKPTVKEVDDIKIVFNYVDLSPFNIVLVPKNEIMSFGDFLSLHRGEQILCENYILKGLKLEEIVEGTIEYLTVNEEEFEQSKVENQNYSLSLIELFDKLSSTNSTIRFEDKFYNLKTGGVDFSLFVPDFEKSNIKANDLVISNKKFNIVLNSTVKGSINYSGDVRESLRYHPFKIVKGGKPVHDEIEVIITDENKSLCQYGIATDDGNVNITISYMMLTNTIKVTLETLIILKSMQNHYKSVCKGHARVLQLMKDKLKETGTFEGMSWYRGEALDDEYISDLGAETLEVWFKGAKNSTSVTRLFNEVELLSGPMESLLIKYSTAERLAENEEMTNFINVVQSIARELVTAKTITADENAMLKTYLSSSVIEGETLIERYKNLMEVYREDNKLLNRIELYLMASRYVLCKNLPDRRVYNNDFMSNFGARVGVGKDYTTYRSPFFYNDPLTIKRGSVTEPYKGSNNNDGDLPFITSEVEGI